MTVYAFHAHLNGNSQTGFTPSASEYNALVWGAVQENIGNRWMSDGYGGFGWQPVLINEVSRRVLFTGQLWWRENATGSSWVAKLWKNRFLGATPPQPGIDLYTALGVKGGYANSIVHTIAWEFVAEPGAIYSLHLNVSSSTAILDGDKRHTWFKGRTLD